MEVDEGSNQNSDIQPHWMAAHACLKNEFMEDEWYHNLMSWLIFYLFPDVQRSSYVSLVLCMLFSTGEPVPANLHGGCLTIFEPRHDKTSKVSVRPAKTQISLGIYPV